MKKIRQKTKISIFNKFKKLWNGCKDDILLLSDAYTDTSTGVLINLSEISS